LIQSQSCRSGAHRNAGEKLDRRSVVRARAGVVNALASGAEDRTCAAILRLNDGWRVEVVTGVDRLGETQILALSPVERSGAARRSPGCEAGDVRTVPNLLGHKVAVIGRVSIDCR
jgi:hypothetical protein